MFSPDSDQIGFCFGSANLRNRAAFEAPGPADTAVQQILAQSGVACELLLWL